ncbi:hypothetical protein ACJQWK_11424 [Exserohilum turcicum]
MQNNHILLLVRASRYTSGKEEQSCKCSEFSIAKLGCGSASPQHQARHPWGSAMTLKGSILIKKLFRRLTRLGVGMGSTDAVQPVPLLIAMRSGELSTAIVTSSQCPVQRLCMQREPHRSNASSLRASTDIPRSFSTGGRLRRGSVTGHDDRKRIAQFRKSAPPAADGGRHFNPRSTSKAANILAAIEKRAHEHLQCTEELVPFESRVTLVKGTQCLLKARAGEYDKSADRRELTVAA